MKQIIPREEILRLAWTAHELAAHPPMISQATSPQKEEVIALFDWLASRGSHLASLTQDSRSLHAELTSAECPPTPHLARMAYSIKTELNHGLGVSRVLGFTALNELQIRILFLKLGSLIGPVVDTYGPLYDVRDLGRSYKDNAIPVSQTRESTGLHTDSSGRAVWPQIIGLACVRPALEGGASRLVSAASAHEVLRVKHPELLTLLYEEYVRDIVTPGSDRRADLIKANRFPIFAGERFGIRYMRYWIERGQLLVNEPLTPDRIRALDALDHALNLPELQYTFEMAAGEMLLINNRTIVHDRDTYIDHPDRPRLMLRLWLTPETQNSSNEEVRSER